MTASKGYRGGFNPFRDPRGRFTATGVGGAAGAP